jgi:hypothetical protein
MNDKEIKDFGKNRDLINYEILFSAYINTRLEVDRIILATSTAFIAALVLLEKDFLFIKMVLSCLIASVILSIASLYLSSNIAKKETINLLNKYNGKIEKRKIFGIVAVEKDERGKDIVLGCKEICIETIAEYTDTINYTFFIAALCFCLLSVV